jgi:hypothetical protein
MSEQDWATRTVNNGGPKPKMQPTPSDIKATHAIGPSRLPRSRRFRNHYEKTRKGGGGAVKLIRACLHAVKCPKMVKQAGVRLRQTTPIEPMGPPRGLLSQISSGLQVIGSLGNLESWE